MKPTSSHPDLRADHAPPFSEELGAPPEVHGLGRREEHHRRILASAASHRLGRDLHEGDGGGKDASAKQNIIWRHGYGFRLSSFCVHTAMENSTCLTWTKL